MKAVIFDLWDTLVDWPVDESEALNRGLAERIGLSDDEFRKRWQAHYILSQTEPLSTLFRTIGVPEEHVETHIAARHEFARRALRPREGAVATLKELRSRGVRLGLISMCSEDVPLIWPETELAGLFDAETFSATTGLKKPDAEIYLATAAALGVPPEECFFVGDGANDELAGAARAGLTPVLMATGSEPDWPEVREWSGLSVSSIPEVLELC
ncbi:MAG TPA: HAD family hydrolase [Gaiellaceae bacterium]|nr:HAD family hydrolase [Gaiellaceae bacterium]